MIEEAHRQMLEAQREVARRHFRAHHLDRVLHTIDSLLFELEDLNLQGVDRVPSALRERIRPVLDRIPRSEDDERIRVRHRVTPMMDVLFLAQEALFRLKDPGWADDDDD